MTGTQNKDLDNRDERNNRDAQNNGRKNRERSQALNYVRKL